MPWTKRFVKIGDSLSLPNDVSRRQELRHRERGEKSWRLVNVVDEKIHEDRRFIITT